MDKRKAEFELLREVAEWFGFKNKDEADAIDSLGRANKRIRQLTKMVMDQATEIERLKEENDRLSKKSP